ncbi:MAG: site-specific DNA-methyltransferase, partial [Rhabdochlamydiaceae bacterium]
ALNIDHTRADRTAEDLLYEVLLKSWGEPALSLKVTEETIEGVRVFSIAEGAFLICLEEKVSLEFIRTLALRKPDRVVMRESAFAGNDQLKTNAVQTFKTAGVTSFKVV